NQEKGQRASTRRSRVSSSPRRGCGRESASSRVEVPVLRSTLFSLMVSLALLGCDGAIVTPDGGQQTVPPCTSDADCDDGVFCDGAEVCDPSAQGADARGCVEGS